LISTGTTKDEDILLYALPMCAPYEAFSRSKFKVKLTPGTSKKGKAARTIVEIFSRYGCNRLQKNTK
jgi:hypothetical protein